MSWLGVKYALATRDERVKLGARLVLVALGVRVEYRKITTSATSLADLHWLTLLSHEQIRRVLDDLEAWRKIRRLRRGRDAIYALPEMAGPLFAVDDGDPVKMTDFVLERLPEKTGQDARKVAGRMPGFRRQMTDFSGRRAGGVLLSSEVCNACVRTSTADENAQAVAEFLAWFHATYLACRRHPYRLEQSEAETVVRELLVDRPPQRLRAMAQLMFDAERDAFITASDYSLFVLRHKASYLEDIAVRNEREAAS